MQIKTTIKYHYLPTTMAKILKLTISGFGKEQWEFSYTADETINCAMIVKNILASILSLSPEVEDIFHDPEIPFLSMNLVKMCTQLY